MVRRIVVAAGSTEAIRHQALCWREPMNGFIRQSNFWDRRQTTELPKTVRRALARPQLQRCPGTVLHSTTHPHRNDAAGIFFAVSALPWAFDPGILERVPTTHRELAA